MIKLYLTAIFFALVAGFLYHYNWIVFLAAFWQRRKLINFAQGVHAAVIQADIGKGKTLLLSILARHLPRGIKKVGFVSNVPDARLLSYEDINFQEKVPLKDTYRIPKYFFLDETNFWIEGVQVRANREYHDGVANLLQIARHHRIHLWISATRGNHVWIAMREIVNYYIKLGGVEPLFNLGRFHFYTLRVEFYNQSWELTKVFNILVSNLDFDLYDSYWLKDTSHWRVKEENNNLQNTSKSE
jgi:hypothetical protein